MQLGGRWKGTKPEMSCHGFASYSPHLSIKTNAWTITVIHLLLTVVSNYHPS